MAPASRQSVAARMTLGMPRWRVLRTRATLLRFTDSAVLRIDVDPGRELTVAQRVRGLARLRVELVALGAELLSLVLGASSQILTTDTTRKAEVVAVDLGPV